MTEMFSIARASLRMGRATWHIALPSGAKLVLLCIISHFNDAQGFAFPSLMRLARLCGLHKRTVQTHITLLTQRGVLQVGKAPGLCCHVYRINEAALAAQPSATDDASGAENFPTEVVLAAPAGGDFSGPCAEITTQNGSNRIQQKKTTEPPAPPCPAPPPPPPPPKMESASPLPLPSSSSYLFLQSLHSPQDQAALQAWQQVRRAKGRPALPNALQCQQLLNHAATVGQSVGWVVQVMALNDWASFDPAWLHNQRPAPRLPAVATPPHAVAPQQPPTQPQPQRPEPPPVTPEEVAQAKARMAELLAQWRGPAATVPDTGPIVPCGIAWADNIIASAVRGETVGYAALDFACSVAKVSRHAVRAAAAVAAANPDQP
ncbi:helix-turn-helix domain-containing protein [Giesbergeria anulus]|uniref:Helix-turn-helix domain-containing protein n=1 Tax=Giesbergeria anulus TaxID=180197 RepID=A0A1H9QDM3_9BURK|nr:helix-turn-helix domain-containing protein [Giesbergeria anulus]SER58537.1 Helix-turn-helix domain-containing protein [Giesbergeria anulus]